ncbi:DUF488 domain-containing protein [Salinibacterium sp. NK8237]|uniref:DUF488 domain-containing protein n=1 Tax=Salinibacterium sp. NK8237 TaxID=2792038 RepID=UPI0018CE4BDE|nr:DUF488 family protein [Salinibacterium sp. NK8237]MBH0131381.1 DUF488 family protein [Salinibacterium sp. NK8237]
MAIFTIARIYDEHESVEEYRVLVDSLWPRGVSKSAAALDENALLPGILNRLTSHARVTLLYGAKDPRINHAVILRDYLAEHA